MSRSALFIRLSPPPVFLQALKSLRRDLQADEVTALIFSEEGYEDLQASLLVTDSITLVNRQLNEIIALPGKLRVKKLDCAVAVIGRDLEHRAAGVRIYLLLASVRAKRKLILWDGKDLQDVNNWLLTWRCLRIAIQHFLWRPIRRLPWLAARLLSLLSEVVLYVFIFVIPIIVFVGILLLCDLWRGIRGLLFGRRQV